MLRKMLPIRSPRAVARRKLLWWNRLPYIIVFLLFIFALRLIRLVEPKPHYINYQPLRASNNLFVTIQSYLIEGDAKNRITGPTTKKDDLVFVLLGIGEFGSEPQRLQDEFRGIAPKLPPDLGCIARGPDQTLLSVDDATIHSKGTAFEGSLSSHNAVRYFGERAVLISCSVPKAVLHHSSKHTRTSGEISEFEFKIISSTGFDTGWTRPQWFLASSVPQQKRDNLVMCSTPIFDLNGARWITEWILYHHFVQGFDEIHLYVFKNGPKTMKAIAHFAEAFDWLHIHNWTSVLSGESNGLDPIVGVNKDVPRSAGYEHGQRLVRTDCYMRNQGKKWVAMIDPDEFLYTRPDINFRKDILPQCEKANVCRFSSVTVHPQIQSSDGMLMKSLLPRCESRCKSQFNCGEYHYGREKYMIKASLTSPIPWTILAIHSVSDNIPYSTDFGNTLVDRKQAFIRHYNPTPYESFGGIPDDRSQECPFPPQALEQIEATIHSDIALSQLYHSAEEDESFLTTSGKHF